MAVVNRSLAGSCSYIENTRNSTCILSRVDLSAVNGEILNGAVQNTSEYTAVQSVGVIDSFNYETINGVTVAVKVTGEVVSLELADRTP